jgi:hypothetical protein
MKYKSVILTVCILLAFSVCGEENNPQPVTQGDTNRNPRMIDLDPNAWNDLPMEVVISDFQESDGIFSSFICDELIKRLVTDTSNSLKQLNKIDRNSRINAFKNCFSPEIGVSSKVIEAVIRFSKKYPILVKEISDSTK